VGSSSCHRRTCGRPRRPRAHSSSGAHGRKRVLVDNTAHCAAVDLPVAGRLVVVAAAPCVGIDRLGWADRRVRLCHVTAASNLSAGSSLVVIVSAQAHLTRVSPLSRPGTRPGIRPVIHDNTAKEETEFRRHGFLSPFGHRHSLLGSSQSRQGSGPSSRSAYPTPSASGPCRDYHVPHSRERPGRVPPIPRGRRCSWTGCRARPAPAASQRPVPAPRWNIPPRGAIIHEASTKVHAIHPSGLPLTRDPYGGIEILRLSPRASHPAVTSSARQGRGQASSMRPGLHHRHHVGPPNCESPRRVRHRVATADQCTCTRSQGPVVVAGDYRPGWDPRRLANIRHDEPPLVRFSSSTLITARRKLASGRLDVWYPSLRAKSDRRVRIRLRVCGWT
jgi:hypothetical protein